MICSLSCTHVHVCSTTLEINEQLCSNGCFVECTLCMIICIWNLHIDAREQCMQTDMETATGTGFSQVLWIEAGADAGFFYGGLDLCKFFLRLINIH